jgi:hypothetical protein
MALPPLWHQCLAYPNQTGCRGESVATSQNPRKYCIDRDALILPEVMVETFECDPAAVMKPLFDVIWNATGLLRS